jgi:hypothetical protein
MPRDSHDGRIAGASFGKLRDGLVAKAVKPVARRRIFDLGDIRTAFELPAFLAGFCNWPHSGQRDCLRAKHRIGARSKMMLKCAG